MHEYNHMILRYVHDILTQEFVNIGILTYSKDLQLVKFIHIEPNSENEYIRIKAMFPNVNKFYVKMLINVVNDNIEKIKLDIKKEKFKDNKVEFEIEIMKIIKFSNFLQWSSKGIGVTESLEDFEKISENLFKMLIVCYNNENPI